MKLTRGQKDTITNSNNVYIDKEKVGEIIIHNKIPYFKQSKNFSLRIDELEKVTKLMREKFKE